MNNRFRFSSLLVPALFSVTLLISSSSCTKEVEVEAPPIDTLAVFTAKEYHMEEITILTGDQFYYYKKGASGNTANFDQDYIKFNTDKTGTYTYYGQTSTLTWDFVEGRKNKVKYRLNRAVPVDITWDNISFSGDSIRYSEQYLTNTLKSMSAGLRIGK